MIEPAVDPSKFLEQEMSSTWQWRLDTDPEFAASLGLLSSRRSEHVLDPRSPSSFDDRIAWVERALQRIRNGITTDQISSSLSDDEKLSYELYVTQLSDYVKYTRKHKAYLCCVNRLEGPQTDLALYARYLPLKTKANREFYRDFLKSIPTQLKEVTSLLSIGLKEGRTPPKISLDGVVKQIRSIVDGKMKPFRKPILGDSDDDISCFNLPDEQSLKDECIELLRADVSQSFVSFADFLELDYVPNLRNEISACKGYPDGEQYYADCLAFHTTTSMTPEEVHQLGVDEVKRVRIAMNDISTEEGYEGRLEEYIEHLRTSPDYESESGEALCAHFRDITGRIGPELLKLFYLKTLPKSPFQVLETPSEHASMAPAAYYLAGSPDPTASRPGMFYVNTSELPTRRTYECEALALHEAIPGHHTQGSIQGENERLPDFRRFAEDRRYFEAPCRFPFYTGYIEGWGLHCETLGDELGLYKMPSSRFGQLSMESLRSCRLVVDTGMHCMGWSTDDALKYMLENTAMGEHDARTEVARYVTWPGQATAYKVGERFIHKLRFEAEEQLGDLFDPRDFYDVVLQCGPVPLNVLQNLVNDYVKKKVSLRSQIPSEARDTVTDSSFVETMTFANWCKCCVIPGACSTI